MTITQVKQGWEVLKLKDVCSKVTDGTHDSPKLQKEGVPFIKGKHISSGNIDFKNCDYITYKDHLDVIKRSKPEKGDILFSNIGSVGDCAYINTDTEFSIKNVALFKPNDDVIDSRYLYYIVCSPLFRGKMLNKKSGSAQPFITLGTLRDHDICIRTKKSEQQKIASILSAFDDLIENNTKRIKILENTAQTIYKEWFVDFKFPGHEKVKMVDSGTEFGEIPEGWEVKQFGDVVNNFDNKRKPVSSMKRLEMKGGFPYYGAAKVIDWVNDYIFDGKYLLIAEDGSVITSEMTPVLQFINEKFWVSNHAHVIQGDIVSTEYLYLFLSTFNINGYITGAAQPKINQKNLNRIKIIVPTAQVHKDFNEIILDIFKNIWNLKKRKKSLRKTRDLLLPKLVSGEVEVDNLEIK